MNKEEVKYKAIKKVGYGECFSDNINYIIENVDRWCGPVFDVYVDGVKVDNPKQYLEDHKPKEPQTLEEKIVDMCYKIDHLKEENKQLKERNQKEFDDLMKRIHDNNDRHLEESNKLIKENFQLKKQRDLYKSVIEEIREYVTNHSLYEEEYDYDYEENSYLSGIDDETATNDILQILDKAKGSDK